MIRDEQQGLAEDLVFLWDAFESLQQRVRVDVEHRTGREGPSDLETSVLAHLMEHPGTPVASIAHALERPPARVRSALVHLARAELVTSRDDGATYQPTAAADSLLRTRGARAVHHLRYLMAGLAPDDLRLLMEARPALQRLAYALRP